MNASPFFPQHVLAAATLVRVGASDEGARDESARGEVRCEVELLFSVAITTLVMVRTDFKLLAQKM